jgi:hypothetical protein
MGHDTLKSASLLAREARRQRRVKPFDAHGWATHLATALVLVGNAESLDEAHEIARDYIDDVTDPKGGADFIPYPMRLRWYARVRATQPPGEDS